MTNEKKSKKGVSSKPRPRLRSRQIGKSPRDRAALRKELMRSAALFCCLFENVNDAIFIHDLDGHFLEVNHVACQRLGYTRRELLLMGVRQLDAPEAAAHFDSGMQVLLQKKNLVVESSHRWKDGA
jgi:PAS domain-containing protein